MPVTYDLEVLLADGTWSPVAIQLDTAEDAVELGNKIVRGLEKLRLVEVGYDREPIGAWGFPPLDETWKQG